MTRAGDSHDGSRLFAAWPKRLRGRTQRPRSGYLHRDPDLILLVIAGVLIGLVGGAAAFTIASSRGLDALSAAEAVGFGWAILALGLAIFGIARLAMFQDLRPLAVLVALISGSAVGDTVAFFTLPGTTTDGSMTLTFRAEVEGMAAQTTGQRATCSWAEDRQSVLAVTSRRPVTPSLVVPTGLSLRIDLSTQAGTSLAATTIDVLAPTTTTPVLRYSGMTVPQSRDATGRIGSVATGAVGVERLSAPDLDPAVIDAVQALVPSRADAVVGWDCPQLP